MAKSRTSQGDRHGHRRTRLRRQRHHRAGYQDAIAGTERALAAEGFGVLTRIDVAATLRAKLGVERDPYLILGACNPGYAHRALGMEPLLGALLPCNVVVHVDEGTTTVSAVSARAMLGAVGNVELDAVADEVDERLARVLAAVAAEPPAHAG